MIFTGAAASARPAESGQVDRVALLNAHCQSLKKDLHGRRIKKGQMHYLRTNQKRHDADTGERVVVYHDDGSIETMLEDSMEPLTDVPCDQKSLEAAYTALTGRADFEVLNEFKAHNSPSGFIGLNQTNSKVRGRSADVISPGGGWSLLAKGKCSNRTCDNRKRRNSRVASSNHKLPLAGIR